MEERKLVTVLFADFVESTALGARHDPEVVRGALGRTFARMQEILVSHGGTVEKFIGDAVMAVFGVPVAHEDDALRALRAAFALRAAAEDSGAASAIALRIGVNTGEVVAGTAERRDLLVTGQPVVVAARLQAACGPGEILVGPLTHQLTEGEVRYTSQRTIDAKGIGLVEGHVAERMASAIPTRRTRRPSLAPFVGREHELDLLGETYRRVSAEHRAWLVTIIGEPGVGKSRLVDEFAARIGGARVRRAHCVPYGAGGGFFTVRELVAQDAGILPTDSREAAERKLRDVVSRTVDAPEAEAIFRRLSVLGSFAMTEDALPDVRVEDMPHELEWAARRYLDRRTAHEPLTLVIEDLHWAEHGFLDTVDRIAEKVQGSLLIICTARPELLELRPGWAAGRANARLLRVEPLDAAESLQLTEALLPTSSRAARQTIISRCDGNPLFIEEVARVQAESGAADAVPASLQELIASRLDQLSPAVKVLLQRASVAGKVFWTDALVALGEEPVDLHMRAADAVRHDFAVELDERGPGGGWAYRFKHGLVRDVAYSSMPKSERSRLHDRFARWLESRTGERRDEHVDVIAYHTEQAFLLARDIGGAEQATLAGRAFPALLRAARVARGKGDARAARALYEQARGLAGSANAPRDDELEAIAYAAIGRLRLEGSREAVEELDLALAAARQLPPSETLVALLSWRGMYAQYESIELARLLHAEAVSVARTLPDPRIVPNALRISATPAAFAGDLDEHRRILEEALPLIRRTGAGGLVQCLGGLAENASQRGDIERAERYLEAMSEAAAGERGVGPVVAALTRARFARFAADRNAVQTAEHAFALAHDLGAPLAVAQAAAILGGALRDDGDLERSRRVLEAGVMSAAGTMPNPDVTTVRCELVRTHAALGELTAAREELGRVTATSATDVATRAYLEATIALVSAAEGNGGDADARYLEGQALLASTGLAADRARLQAERGMFLLESGRVDDAKLALEAARAFFSHPRLARRRDAIDAILALA